MKKIMIAFATTIFAVVANAASISWMSMTTDLSGTPLDISAFCDADGKAYETMPTGVAIVLASISGDLTGDFTVKSVIGDVGVLDAASGSIVAGNFDAAYDSSFPFKNGDVLAVIAQITDADDNVSYSALKYVADGSVVNDTLTVSGLSGDDWYADLYFGTKGSYTAVPEPTSGLLLLVGMAGLALRRKRA